jgi:3-deoxy-D-arabino-heptulosonate 7-phosphate (DAHP) synthase
MVPYLAEAAIALGADGLVIETHYDPSAELVDKDQTITTSVFARLVKECNDLYQVVQKPNWARL